MMTAKSLTTLTADQCAKRSRTRPIYIKRAMALGRLNANWTGDEPCVDPVELGRFLEQYPDGIVPGVRLTRHRIARDQFTVDSTRYRDALSEMASAITPTAPIIRDGKPLRRFYVHLYPERLFVAHSTLKSDRLVPDESVLVRYLGAAYGKLAFAFAVSYLRHHAFQIVRERGVEMRRFLELLYGDPREHRRIVNGVIVEPVEYEWGGETREIELYFLNREIPLNKSRVIKAAF